MNDDFDVNDDIFTEFDDIMLIAVGADSETWLPAIFIAIPVETDEIVDGHLPMTLTSDQAYQIGAYLIQAASTVSSYHTELIEKTIEERREILCLESMFLGYEYDGDDPLD